MASINYNVLSGGDRSPIRIFIYIYIYIYIYTLYVLFYILYIMRYIVYIIENADATPPHLEVFLAFGELR